MTKQQVRWTDHEVSTLLEASIKHGRHNPGLSLTHLLNDAQVCLPDHRRRRLLTYKSFKRWTEVVAGLKSEPEPAPPLVVQVVKSSWQDCLREMPTAALLEEIECRRADAVAERLGMRISQATHVALTPRPEPVNGPRSIPPSPPRKRQIVIIGLMRDQFRHVMDKAGTIPLARFELVFHDKDSAEKPPPADFIIVQRHSSHRHWDQARNASDNVIFVDGGTSGVARKLQEIFTTPSL
jgi:hypothetical protein